MYDADRVGLEVSSLVRPAMLRSLTISFKGLLLWKLPRYALPPFCNYLFLRHLWDVTGDTEVQSLPWSIDGNSYALQQTGMHLWYADTENTFQQYYTYENMTSWVQQKKWTGMSGHAGVGCNTPL